VGYIACEGLERWVLLGFTSEGTKHAQCEDWGIAMWKEDGAVRRDIYTVNRILRCLHW
jgi:hypothetical protein